MRCLKCNSENTDTARFCSNCATALNVADEAQPSFTKTIETPQEELATGSIFAGRYQIIEELGKGGMGKVYRVLDKKLNEEVALKLIKPEIASDKKTLERFKNELKLARKVVQKNVGRMFDLGEETGRHYITMEYVSGEDLRSFIRRVGQIPVGKSISIAKQLSEGLSEAHNIGIVHRDLKPSNIMIDKQGNARIMDFGIARSVEAKKITGAGVIIGTPEYMSPEQVEGKDTDARSDIYSLGIILYEMTTGRLPFEGDTPFSVGVKQKSEEPADPRSLNPQIPEDLSQVILKCLEKDKDQRYSNAGALLSELEKIGQSLPTTTGVAVPRKPLTSREITVTFGMRKLIVPVIAVMALFVVGLVLWRPWARKAVAPVASDKPSLAVLYYQNNTGNDGYNVWRDGLCRMVIADLSQSKFLDVLGDDQIYGILKQLDLLEAANYSPEDLKEIASKSNASYVLRGILTKAGDSFRVSTTLQEMGTMDIIDTLVIDGEGEGSLHAIVDELTRRIKEKLDLTPGQIASDVDREVGTITTGSPEAFKFYAEGRKYHYAGDYEKSVLSMEKAIAIDPEFAMAYRSIAMSQTSLRYFADSRRNLEKAFELSGRLPDRERYIIQGDYYRRSEKTYDKAIEAYDRLLEIYPDDRTGNNNSASLYVNLEMWDEAIERYERAIQTADPSVQGYSGLASVYFYKGQHEKARELLQEYINNYGDNALLRARLAEAYVLQRQMDKALEELDRAFALNPKDFNVRFGRGCVFLYLENFQRAADEFKAMLDIDNPVTKAVGTLGWVLLDILRGRGSKALESLKQAIDISRSFDQTAWVFNFLTGSARVHSAFGRWERAKKDLEEALRISVESESLGQQRLALRILGVCHIRSGAMSEAQRTADSLRLMVEGGANAKDMRDYEYLQGLIDHENGNNSGALERLERAIALLPSENNPWDGHAEIFYRLAEVHADLEDWEKAREWYEKVVNLTHGRLYFPDTYVLSYFKLGNVFEALGKNAEAIANYEKFLDLWGDADPGLREVEDARKRLAGLKGNG